MNRTFKNSLLSTLSLVCVLAFQNCSKVSFTSDPASTNIANGVTDDGPNCRVDLVNTTKQVKVLFLIDTSGSNEANNGTAGTDMNKVWRLATINSFINAYGSKSNFAFGFATFQGTSAKPLIKENNYGVFTSNMSEINQAITDFTNTPDKDSTPYDAALGVVKSMISYDQSKNKSKEAGYVVVMISDGSPSNSSYTDSKNGMTNLTNDVNNILAVAPGQISLNTVFLYNQNAPNASQKSYLQTISSLGSGSFIEANSQQVVQISDSVQVPKEICQ